MKKLLALFVLLTGVTQAIYAQEPYWALSHNRTTATLYYDTMKKNRGDCFDLFWVQTGGGSIADGIDEVRIDASFADYHGLTDCSYLLRFKNATRIIGLGNLKTENVTNMEGMFSGCSKITDLYVSSFNTAKVTDMSGMFWGCSSLKNLDISNFTTSNVTDMAGMFTWCSLLTSLDVSNFNTAKVTNMSDMFAECSSLTSLNVSNFNTSNVTDMSGMFSGCSSLTSVDVSKFNTANVMNMRWMFCLCSKLTILDVSNFNTAKVTDMGVMFGDCSSLTSIDVSNFNTGNVTDMGGMFAGCSLLTSLDVSNFNTAKVTDMAAMFGDCSSLTSLNVSNFNTSNVSDLGHMFSGCSKLTSLELNNFNTVKVTSFQGMFEECSSLTSLDVSNFSVANYTDISYMFYGCSNLSTIYCNDTWNSGQNNVFTGCISLKGGSGTTYSVDKTSSDYAHPYSEGYFTGNGSSAPFALLEKTTGTLTLMYGVLTDEIIANYSNQGVKVYQNWNNFYRDHGNRVIKHAVFDSSCSDYYPSHLSYLFSELEELEDIVGFQYLNTSGALDMSGMFNGCASLISLDISSFNTSNVSDMSGMFSYCNSLTSLDVSRFNTSNVTTMQYMFESCSSLTHLNVSNFNTSNVQSMYSMFYDCSCLTSLDVTNFNTSNVNDMHSMFKGCSSLTSLDVSNFDTRYVTNLRGMFSLCGNLKTIYCNDTWATGQEEVFDGCESIKGGDGTTYSAANISSDYAHPNSGGYFTAKRTTFSTVTIGNQTQYWSSFYTTTRNVKADNSTTVYTATLSSDGKELTLNEIADRIIPCGQAVLMKSTTKDPVFQTSSSEGTGDYSTNSLQGTQVDIPTSSIEGTVYTLASENGDFGFFRYTGETLKAGKAFLVVPGGAAARITIVGLDEATGIQSVSTKAQQESYYDMQGRRVNAPQKGIYIINRQKVIK